MTSTNTVVSKDVPQTHRSGDVICLPGDGFAFGSFFSYYDY